MSIAPPNLSQPSHPSKCRTVANDEPSEQAGQAKHDENYMYDILYICVCVRMGSIYKYNISEEGCGLTVQMSFIVFIRSLLYKTVFKSPHLKTGLTKSKHFHPSPNPSKFQHLLIGILISDILTSMQAKMTKHMSRSRAVGVKDRDWITLRGARHPLTLGIRTHSGMSLQGQ